MLTQTTRRVGAVEITPGQLVEFDEATAVLTIDRSSTSSVRVTTGIQSERPLVELSLVAIVLLFAIVIWGVVARWLMWGGTLHFAVPTAGAVLSVLGSTMLVHLLRTGAVITVSLRSGATRRVLAGPRMSTTEVESALGALGWPIA